MDTKPPNEENEINEDARDEYNSSKGKFRFKSSPRSSRHKHRHKHRDDDRRHHHHHHNHQRHRRSKPKPTTRSASPDATQGPRSLSPDTAFRESLFDALGDDEGAAYWEGVYGQPIHTYTVPRDEGPAGELERMTEEEYAAYVRARMWERTREGMVEEQERMRAERAKRKRWEQDQEREWKKRDKERSNFERAMEESLARGEQRRKTKAWKGVWETYHASWERIEKAVTEVNASSTDATKKGEENKLRNLLFWPVESGKRRDVSREKVEEFMRRAPPPSESGSGDMENLLATLKAERVRWHPDKIQHRYGVLGVDEPVMRSVTEVFQIIDHLWNEVKK